MANIKNWIKGTGAYKISETALAQGEIISSWTNLSTILSYETFTSSGTNITSAINTTGAANVVSSFSTTAGKRYKLTFNFVLNSGQLPSIFSGDSTGGGTTVTRSLNSAVSNGFNSFEFTAFATRTEYIQFYNSVESNWSLSNFSLTEIPHFQP